jgi:hypothetical protein
MVERHERHDSTGPAGVSAMACVKEESTGNTESKSMDRTSERRYTFIVRAGSGQPSRSFEKCQMGCHDYDEEPIGPIRSCDESPPSIHEHVSRALDDDLRDQRVPHTS